MIMNNQFFDDLHISDITVISGIRQDGRTADHSLRGRQKCGILYIWEGEATFRCDNKEKIVVSDGHVVYLPKHKKYKMEYTAESTTFVLVNFDLFDRDNNEISIADTISVLATDDASKRIARTMTKFELCSASKDFVAVLLRKELMYRLLRLISDSSHEFSSKSEFDSRIIDGVHLLERTYLENLPITKYAEAANTNVNMFRRLFQKQFGTSPVKYRNNLRIERAKELLSEGNFTISEVAYASGFENVGYFCRCYRQITGEAPGQTKKRNQYN